jgi:hypothetical protein
MPAEKMVFTKRGVLTKLAKIYDPLGFISPLTLTGKLIYRAACDTKNAWDGTTSRNPRKVVEQLEQ